MDFYLITCLDLNLPVDSLSVKECGGGVRSSQRDPDKVFIGTNLPGRWSPEMGVTRGRRGSGVMWRGNGPAPPGHSEEICTGNISQGFVYYWLIMKVTFVNSKECVCCYSDGDLEMVHLRVTGECGAKELGQSCLLTRPWTLNRNIESEGEKQLEIIIQYPVRPAEIRHICQQRDTQLSDDLMKNWFLRILFVGSGRV